MVTKDMKKYLFQFKICKNNKQILTRKKEKKITCPYEVYCQSINFFIQERMQNGLAKTSTIKFGFLPPNLYDVIFNSSNHFSIYENYKHNGEKYQTEVFKSKFSNLPKHFGNENKIPSFIETSKNYLNKSQEKFQSNLLEITFYYNTYSYYLVFEIYYETKFYNQIKNDYVLCG